MRGLVDMLEKHHNVRILDEAVAEAVRLSHRYLSGRQLPDKSVQLLDTACARVAMARTPCRRRSRTARRRIDAYRTERACCSVKSPPVTDHCRTHGGT